MSCSTLTWWATICRASLKCLGFLSQRYHLSWERNHLSRERNHLSDHSIALSLFCAHSRFLADTQRGKFFLFFFSRVSAVHLWWLEWNSMSRLPSSFRGTTAQMENPLICERPCFSSSPRSSWWSWVISPSQFWPFAISQSTNFAISWKYLPPFSNLWNPFPRNSCRQSKLFYAVVQLSMWPQIHQKCLSSVLSTSAKCQHTSLVTSSGAKQKELVTKSILGIEIYVLTA